MASKHRSSGSELVASHWTLPKPKWMPLASAFGWKAHHATKSAYLVGALAIALDQDRPRLLVLPLDYREHVLYTEHFRDFTAKGGVVVWVRTA